jgi:hypothetical protein
VGRRGPQKSLEASAHGAIPDCPFTKKERPDDFAAWEEITAALVDAGLSGAYAESDFAAVERASVLLARARRWSQEAAKVVAAGEWYVDTKSNGLMPHPALREERQAWEVLAKALVALGMDPRTRADLVAPDPTDEDDDFETSANRYSPAGA